MGDESELKQRVVELEREVEDLKRWRASAEWQADHRVKAALLKIARDTRLARIARGD
jgi:U3 small nucleolar ribonucleoprotein component